MLCLTFTLGVCANVNTRTAQAITRKQVERKVSALKKEVKSFKKQYKKAAASDARRNKGVVSIFGDVISFNPFVVKDTLKNSYYWVTNSEKLNRMMYVASGRIKPTGKYRKYNGITCAVAKAVKTPNTLINIKKKLEKKQTKLKEYQRSLKEKVLMSSSVDLYIGESHNLNPIFKCTGKYVSSSSNYNKVIWKSSNKKVVIVKDGIIKAKKAGKVNITATCSISKKVSICKVYVTKNSSADNNDNNDDDNNANNDNNDEFFTILDETNRTAESGTAENHPFRITASYSDILILITVPEPVDMRVRFTNESGYDNLVYDESVPASSFNYYNDIWYYSMEFMQPPVGDYKLAITFADDTKYTVSVLGM